MASCRAAPSSQRERSDAIRFKMVVAFDGTRYEGWQVQTMGTGVQAKVEAALAALFPSGPRVHSSSRTDTGVHALGMVAHFDIPRPECRIPPRQLVLALNAHLPSDIRVFSIQRVAPQFHARFSAIGKQYRYQVWNHPAMNPLLRFTAWHVPRRLDLRAMQEAAARFLGTHDFRAFSANPGYPRESTVRTVRRCEWRRQGCLLTCIIEADGFLYKMCRAMVGTMIQVGLGKHRPEDIPRMLASGDRRAAGMTAPAHGLILWKVFYPMRKAGADQPADTGPAGQASS
ncbi:MAG: tRNA pseudouridine(38-40) synthase TruA [Verrucomicrobiota bacterium]|nr:tRNA pseudouridine(38-40) synthase TruA [Limisphaera sp.]MDW8382027.1 tRNA pseudouridine(38-40) synthase TruA [Verrucomicrobiota bacterium]